MKPDDQKRLREHCPELDKWLTDINRLEVRWLILPKKDGEAIAAKMLKLIKRLKAAEEENERLRSKVFPTGHDVDEFYKEAGNAESV